MNYLITEQIAPSGLPRYSTRTKVITVPEGEEPPAGAVPTEEEPRDWQLGSPVASLTEDN